MRVQFGQATEDGQGHWSVEVTRIEDDGTVTTGCHVFPTDTLEWRAAEYGIDPSDVDTLMDIVLVEPYLTDDHWQAGSRLHDADTIEQARADHLARCAQAKLACRMSTRGKSAEPLRAVRERHDMHPEALEMKREMVRRGREQHRTARALQSRDAERVAGLREALDQMNPDRHPRRKTP
jgi:hypothetical protein